MNLVLRIERFFDVPRERVFDAWLSPETSSRWLFNSGGERISNEIDARPGGAWLMTNRQGGTDYTVCGQYLEIHRPRSLAFSFAMPQFSPNKDRIDIKFEKQSTGCRMTFTQEGVDISRELKQVPNGEESETEQGWKKMFDTLESILT